METFFYQCIECGKRWEEIAGGIGGNVNFLCADCKNKFPKRTIYIQSDDYWVSKIFYNGSPYTEVTGDCKICHSFPCKHTLINGDFIE